MNEREPGQVVQPTSSSPSGNGDDGRLSQSNSSATKLIERLEQNIATVLLGKPEPIRLVVVSLLAQGHVLIEDAPGVGKTSLAKAVAKSLNSEITRIQFTPDLLPSDILGSSVFLQNIGDFEFRPGPIFTNILLADEINRTTPRTQSALLEAMSERQVSIEGTTYPLEPPFFVIATQNPFESEGTYPLPENQLDRFMICTGIGYPSREYEAQVLVTHRKGEPVDSIQAVIQPEELVDLQAKVLDVKVEDSINHYLLDIVEATRNHKELELGVSTRGALTLHRAAQSLALVEGRSFVVPDDLKRLAIPVLAHRIICRGLIREGYRDRAKKIIQQILDSVAVPS